MKNLTRIHKYLAMLTLAALCAFSAIAQSANEPASTELKDYQTPGSILHMVDSSIIEQTYELAVSLPADYTENKKGKYPVIYVLDGQWNFSLITSITGKLIFDKDMTNAIVVAVTWTGDPNVLRGRDFTPSAVSRISNSGGGKKFLTILEKELIPLIESQYRVNSERILIGSSLGGLFVSYALLENPTLFTKYIASAAALPLLSDELMSQKLKQLAASKLGKNTRIFISCGLEDRCSETSKKFSEQLTALNIPNLEVKLMLIEGLGHTGAEPIGYTYGLKFAFKK